jgi:hypothetical protein
MTAGLRWQPRAAGRRAAVDVEEEVMNEMIDSVPTAASARSAQGEPMPDDLLAGAIFRLPSERHVRIVSLKGPITTCLYCNEAGEPDVQELEAAVSLSVEFLRTFGKWVAAHAPPMQGLAE